MLQKGREKQVLILQDTSLRICSVLQGYVCSKCMENKGC